MLFNPAKRRARKLEAAQGYLILGMVEQALAELRSVPSPELAGYEWSVLMGEALREKKSFAEALVHFEEAARERPDDIEVLMGLAWCYKRTNQLRKSIEAMLRAREAHPDEPIIPYNLACYCALAGETSRAAEWMRKALKMRPELRELVSKETDFDAIRDDDEFLQALSSIDPVE